MDTSVGGEHPEAPGRVGPGADSHDHPALRRLDDRLRGAGEALRERVQEYLRAADDAETKTKEETNGE